jgi:hypothetical protein
LVFKITSILEPAFKSNAADTYQVKNDHLILLSVIDLLIRIILVLVKRASLLLSILKKAHPEKRSSISSNLRLSNKFQYNTGMIIYVHKPKINLAFRHYSCFTN